MNKDIFDMKNIDDIPFTLPKITNPIKEKIMVLFTIKNILTLRELRVGLYRKYEIVVTSTSLSTHIHTLKIDKKITNIGLGTYKLIRRNKC